MKFKIHPDYNIYFQTVGATIQTRVALLSPKTYTQDTELVMVEPGRTIIIGNIKDELRNLFGECGKPALNVMTATKDRPGGIFSSRSYTAMLDYLFDDHQDSAPRIRKTIAKEIVYRDTIPA